jgi:hypothetical protein
VVDAGSEFLAVHASTHGRRPVKGLCRRLASSPG